MNYSSMTTRAADTPCTPYLPVLHELFFRFKVELLSLIKLNLKLDGQSAVIRLNIYLEKHKAWCDWRPEPVRGLLVYAHGTLQDWGKLLLRSYRKWILDFFQNPFENCDVQRRFCGVTFVAVSWAPGWKRRKEIKSLKHQYTSLTNSLTLMKATHWSTG